MAPSTVSICLFERSPGGHFPFLTRELSSALAPVASVTVAASDRIAEELSDLPVELIPLGESRARHGENGVSNEALAAEELELVRDICARTNPDHLFHLFTDPILRWLSKGSPMPRPVTTIVFHPCSHYRRAFGTSLTPKRALRARFLEHKVRRWRRRPDANAIFTLDPKAAALWAGKGGAPAHWLPEPPVPIPDGVTPPEQRLGCAVYGGFEPRKGMDLLADALEAGAGGMRLVVAGHCVPGFEAELDESLSRMRAGGVQVDALLGWPATDEALRALASARCLADPYRWHPGTSRVMLEAAALGLPIVGPSYGLVGHHLREYGLGIAVDPRDAVALREAVLELTEDPLAYRRYEAALRRYTEEMSGDFAVAVRAAFGLAR